MPLIRPMLPYALEAMPWMYPDSVDSYLSLIEAIDRKACGGSL